MTIDDVQNCDSYKTCLVFHIGEQIILIYALSYITWVIKLNIRNGCDLDPPISHPHSMSLQDPIHGYPPISCVFKVSLSQKICQQDCI
jgi:hypothetical protein